MPLRDHFRPPISKHSSWEGFHGMWPMAMVQQLARTLPPEFSAEPRVHLGSYFEFDESGSVETATWAPPEPTLTF